jgi:hypothetical protein
MSQVNPFVYAATAMTLSQLTNDEVIAFSNFLSFGRGNPEHNMAWPKVKPLFTQQLTGGGVAMHDETRIAAKAYLAKRVDEIFYQKEQGE